MIHEKRGMIWAPDPKTCGPLQRSYSGVVLLEFECASKSFRDLVEMQILIL